MQPSIRAGCLKFGQSSSTSIFLCVQEANILVRLQFLFCDTALSVLFSFAIISLRKREGAGCLTLIVLLLVSGCSCCVYLPRGAMLCSVIVAIPG